MKLSEQQLREMIRDIILEDVRKVGNKYCAYVDDKVTKKKKTTLKNTSTNALVVSSELNLERSK